jgi:SHS2 domain-containing protein
MNKKPYKYLPHTADVKFEAYGGTIEEAFSNAVLAMVNLMVDERKINPVTTKTVSFSAHDKEALLYNFLEEVLFLHETSSFLPQRVKEIKIDLCKRPSLKATFVLGNANEVRDYIKAVTYNEMEIKEEGGRWMVRVVLDV